MLVPAFHGSCLLTSGEGLLYMAGDPPAPGDDQARFAGAPNLTNGGLLPICGGQKECDSKVDR